MVEVKMENVMESAADGAAFNSLSKQPQYRPQQMAAAGHHVQSGHQFKQMGAVQAALPRLQSQYVPRNALSRSLKIRPSLGFRDDDPFRWPRVPFQELFQHEDGAGESRGL